MTLTKTAAMPWVERELLAEIKHVGLEDFLLEKDDGRHEIKVPIFSTAVRDPRSDVCTRRRSARPRVQMS